MQHHSEPQHYNMHFTVPVLSAPPWPAAGDPARVLPHTIHQTSYTASQAPPPHAPYSRSAAVDTILTSSVHLGGSPQINGFHTTVQDTFCEPQTRTCTRTKPVPRFPRNASFMSAGDLEPARAQQRISHTTTKAMHPVVRVGHVLW